MLCGTIPADADAVILYKTAKATDELKSEKRSLSMLQRRALLLADGTRDSDEIRASLNRPDSAELLYLLIRQGYLSEDADKRSTLPNAGPAQTPAAKPAPAPAPVTALPAPAPAVEQAARPLAPEIRQRIEAIIRRSSENHLGLFARGILDELVAADSDARLRGCISRWHVALIESRGGRDVAAELLAEVDALWQDSPTQQATAAA
ncbi:MAG: hypothetical protein ACKOXG_10250 [Arenimonas sp.]